MTEEEARDRVAALVTPRAFAAIERFVARVRVESERQNLVARATLDAIWQRHVLDSAQLLPLAAAAHDGTWIDVGTGAGFPGMIVGLAGDRETLLVEPRRMRADFLRNAADDPRIRVIQSRIERVPPRKAAIVSARAVAPAYEILAATKHLRAEYTLYLLPKGQSATTESVDAQRLFAGMFHVEQSLTDPSSGIIVASQVRPRP